jgi:hypothetical protein
LDLRFVLLSIVYFARGTSRSFWLRFEIIWFSRWSMCINLFHSCRCLLTSFVARIFAAATDSVSALAMCATKQRNIRAGVEPIGGHGRDDASPNLDFVSTQARGRRETCPWNGGDGLNDVECAFAASLFHD